MFTLLPLLVVLAAPDEAPVAAVPLAKVPAL